MSERNSKADSKKCSGPDRVGPCSRRFDKDIDHTACYSCRVCPRTSTDGDIWHGASCAVCESWSAEQLTTFAKRRKKTSAKQQERGTPSSSQRHPRSLSAPLSVAALVDVLPACRQHVASTCHQLPLLSLVCTSDTLRQMEEEQAAIFFHPEVDPDGQELIPSTQPGHAGPQPDGMTAILATLKTMQTEMESMKR